MRRSEINLILRRAGEFIRSCGFYLPPRLYHAFWAEGGRVLIGEVSLVNDDYRDNRFLDAPGRFPEIEEDEPPLYLLATDYQHFYGVKHGQA